ncbi:MAG: hypothetical protein ACPL7D_05850 [Candidatus Sumerlaeaceae bacterium]
MRDKKQNCNFGTIWLGSLFSVAILATASAFAQQSLPWHEPFAYGSGNLVGQGDWTQTGTGTSSPIQVATSSLSYFGLPPSSGGKITLGNGSNYQDAGHDVTNQSSASVYASFVLKVSNPGNTTGDYIFHFSSAGAGAQDFRARLYVRQGSSASKFQLGLANANTDTPQWGSSQFDVEVPVFVVVAYAFNGDVNDDMTYLWVNPPLGQSASPTPDVTKAALQDLTALGRVGVRQGAGNSLLSLELDELRVGTAWQDVTPALSSAVGEWFLY